LIMNRSAIKVIALFIISFNLGPAAMGAKSLHNPNFLRKLADPVNYEYNKTFPLYESICGTDDLVDVVDYDGSRGQPVEFVNKNETAVAALAYGKVENSKKYCTGTMITEDLFLTASHCVDNSILQEFAVFNYQKTKDQETATGQEHVRVLEVLEQGNGGLDYAILKLEGAPGLKYGFTPINVNEIQTGHLLTIIQHPRGRPKMVDIGNCNGTRGILYMTYGNLDTEPGSSGAGVLDETGNLVGVHTNGGCMVDGGENAGVMMTEIVKHSPIIQKLTGTKNFH
jgi:V8-like Glu-specific endopeptidase